MPAACARKPLQQTANSGKVFAGAEKSRAVLTPEKRKHRVHAVGGCRLTRETGGYDFRNVQGPLSYVQGNVCLKDSGHDLRRVSQPWMPAECRSASYCTSDRRKLAMHSVGDNAIALKIAGRAVQNGGVHG